MMQPLCIIVEGRSDKLKLEQVLAENAMILCTNGTISEDDLLQLLEPYETHMLITMFDADKNGHKLRQLMNRIYPEAIQLIIPAEYIEVAETPVHIIGELLKQIKIQTK